MRVLVTVLLLTVPVAAGTAFLTLPAPLGAATPCGSDACFPLASGEAMVQVQGGARYAFLGPDGIAMERGPLCAPAMLPIPTGATLLVVTPGTCER